MRTACGVGEGAPQSHDLSHVLGHALGELARVDAAEAPADQRELAFVTAVKLVDACCELLAQLVVGPEVGPEQPRVHPVPEPAEVAPEHSGRPVPCGEAREHEDGRLIYDSELHYTESIGGKAKKNLEEKIGTNKYYEITQTFKHSPKQKISFEYAKTCYHVGNSKQALKVAQELINTINLDWRTVFRTYYLIAKINFDLGNMNESKKYNELALRAHSPYSLELKLKKLLISSSN